VLPRVYGPNVDGYVFPDQPIKLIGQQSYPAMPVIIGNTAGETAQWADTAGRVTDEGSYTAAIDRVFGSTARERVLNLYPPANYASPRAAFAQVTTDAAFPAKADVSRGSSRKPRKSPSTGICSTTRSMVIPI